MNLTDRPTHNRSTEKAHFLASFHRYKSLLARKFWIPALCVLTGLVSIWSLSWYGPPSFISVGRMIVSTKLASQETSAYTEEMNNFLGTQAALMQSDEVLRRALSRVALLYPDGARERTGAGPAVKLKVAVTPKTSIFVLTGTGTDRQWTRTFVQYCMEEFKTVKDEMRARTSNAAVGGLGLEIGRLEGELQKNDQAQVEFETTNSMALFEEQGNSIGNYLAAMNQRLAALTSEFELLQSLSLDQSLERWQQMGTALPIVDDLTGRYGALGQNAPSSVDELATDYLRAKQQMLLLKADQEEMSQYLQDQHPKMVAMAEEIAYHNRLLDIYRQQGLDQLESRTNSLALQIKNLEHGIKQWNVKALDISKKLAEYHRLKTKAQRFESIYDHMYLTMETLDVNKEVTPDSVTIMEPASEPVEGRPTLARLMAAGGLAGLILGVGLLMLLDRMDDRMASVTELQELFDEEILAQIPRERAGRKREIKLLMPDDTRHSYVESYRNLRSSLLYMAEAGKRPKTLLLTSSVPNDGKSVTASNLAITMASAGSRVLLVDADLRKGILHNRFEVPSGPGLCEVLSEKQNWKQAVQTTHYPNLWLLCRGSISRHSSELFLSPVMDKFIEEVAPLYDFILFDTAPVMAADDVTSLAPRIDGVVFVVRSEHTSARVAHAALQLLYQRQVRVLGVVFNAVRPRSGDYYYYYKYKDYYKSYPGGGDGESESRQRHPEGAKA
ncbi:MAG: polysaccharide biosynthesis tyrosine autokinase [Verrucomicrobiota bacterium]|jgi:capsular exopolysaccharide synthesis family protein